MEKARFVSKYSYRRYNEYITEIEYEYRGHKYTVYINHNKGNEPLSWQHRNAQGRIDSLIEIENKKQEQKSGISVDEALQEFLKYCNS